MAQIWSTFADVLTEILVGGVRGSNSRGEKANFKISSVLLSPQQTDQIEQES